MSLKKREIISFQDNSSVARHVQAQGVLVEQSFNTIKFDTTPILRQDPSFVYCLDYLTNHGSNRDTVAAAKYLVDHDIATIQFLINRGITFQYLIQQMTKESLIALNLDPILAQPALLTIMLDPTIYVDGDNNITVS